MGAEPVQAEFRVYVYPSSTSLTVRAHHDGAPAPAELVMRAIRALEAELDELTRCPIHLEHRP